MISFHHSQTSLLQRLLNSLLSDGIDHQEIALAEIRFKRFNYLGKGARRASLLSELDNAQIGFPAMFKD